MPPIAPPPSTTMMMADMNLLRNIDLDHLVHLCERVYGWSHEKATRVLQEYRRFLELKVVLRDFRGNRIAPSICINQMWHQHILDTLVYYDDCNKMCGTVIHHDPRGLPSNLDAKQRRIDDTKLAYQARYGQEMDPTIWFFADIHHMGDNNIIDNDDDQETGPILATLGDDPSAVTMDTFPQNKSMARSTAFMKTQSSSSNSQESDIDSNLPMKFNLIFRKPNDTGVVMRTIVLKRSDKFRSKLESFAESLEKYGVSDPQSVQFVLDGQRIKLNEDTPDDLGCGNDVDKRTIHCQPLFNEPSIAFTVRLELEGGGGQHVQKYRMKPYKSFERIFRHFAGTLNRPTHQLEFTKDSVILGDTDSPLDVDLKEGGVLYCTIACGGNSELDFT